MGKSPVDHFVPQDSGTDGDAVLLQGVDGGEPARLQHDAPGDLRLASERMPLTAWRDGDPALPAEFHHCDDVVDVVRPDHCGRPASDETAEVPGHVLKGMRSDGQGAAETFSEQAQRIARRRRL
ncbi:hypothetical protein GCM10010517_41610 [Streptosporangium fragile]|uniref:Uncharacterized protein n=1 Tax=Streptosporangium fragile TaxID=46186 RepID=A0ABN3W0F2_9ACTN